MTYYFFPRHTQKGHVIIHTLTMLNFTMLKHSKCKAFLVFYIIYKHRDISIFVSVWKTNVYILSTDEILWKWIGIKKKLPTIQNSLINYTFYILYLQKRNTFTHLRGANYVLCIEESTSWKRLQVLINCDYYNNTDNTHSDMLPWKSLVQDL